MTRGIRAKVRQLSRLLGKALTERHQAVADANLDAALDLALEIDELLRTDPASHLQAEE